jgi:2-oxoisovalerate dehydrogenase E1 component alpha subunit
MTAASSMERIALYRAMVLARRVDERARALFESGEIGFHVSSVGEEAAIVGAAFALREQDWIFPCYREHGAALLRGWPVVRYFDNLFGNANDLARGRQMAGFWSYRSARIASASAPNGTHLGAGVGLAWAAKMRGDPLCALIYLDDEATSSSDFHNALNFAGVYAAPAVFFCKNDGWAREDGAAQTGSETIAEKGIAYGVEATRCDGGDALAVTAAVSAAVARAVTGGGPTLIEALTRRGAGDHDPNAALRRRLEGWDDIRQAALCAEIDAQIDEAVSAAKRTGPPPAHSMFDDVFAAMPWHLREQRDELGAAPKLEEP